LSVGSVVCCQVEVSATDLSLVQRSPADCGVSFCVWSRNLKNGEAMARVGPQRHKKNNTRKNKHELVIIHVTVSMFSHQINRITYSILTDGYILANNSLQHQI
jgi:hypothetical protein